MADELKLERDLMHTQFSSWRLQRLATVNRYQLCATGHASGIATTALDFLHTRASVLRNHLLLSESRLFIFTQSEHKPGYFIYELLPVPASDQGLLASQVAELGTDTRENSAGGTVEAVVDCSLVVVVGAPGTGRTVSPLSTDVGTDLPPLGSEAAPSGAPPPQEQLLLSRGHGDIVIMRRCGDHVSYSNAVHPLRPRLPHTGVRPLILEAAFAEDNGNITAVVWAMRSKGLYQAACCEVFAVVLGLREEPEGQMEPGGEPAPWKPGPTSLHLTTLDVRLLLRTKLPPYVARVLPPEPQLHDLQSPPHSGPAAAGRSGGGHDRVVLVGFDPNTAELEDEHEEGGAAPTEATVCGVVKGAGGRGDDDINDDDDMDPRTLEQAAARLANMTSDEREGPQSRAQWADIYKETGPDGVGAMGNEPAMDLAAWRLSNSSGGNGGVGVAERTDKPLTPFWRLCCGAHRLLTAEGPVQMYYRHQPQPQPQTQAQPLLLGVTDDVDCAVLQVDCWRRCAAQQPESGRAAGEEAAESGQLAVVQVRHVVSIPALAYVAAGKTYKRHLLLSSPGTSTATGKVGNSKTSLAAVLVESQRFMYLYGVTTTQQEYGMQQVVELDLEEGETVLGARLVEIAAVPAAEGLFGVSGERCGSAAAAAAAAAGGDYMVVVATQRRLLSYRLQR
ncbi:hypothetical protein Vretimale_15539 [Volvox reticuliferus]|uniref:Uncharacterized protein n=1 Tax=Volvox reticuliferus TaxID=1737510 RepID=A0A8J4GQZ4_9CHLO|nr:hypothetical protein Vretifemale_15127 [Volvox reticuliferus]GIM12116.1 hypothetical protein Vretimale_15539 [Volvox reticuliferus]